MGTGLDEHRARCAQGRGLNRTAPSGRLPQGLMRTGRRSGNPEHKNPSTPSVASLKCLAHPSPDKNVHTAGKVHAQTQLHDSDSSLRPRTGHTSRGTKLPARSIPIQEPPPRRPPTPLRPPESRPPGIAVAGQPRCTKIPTHRCHSPSSDSSTARLTILCIHHGPHSQTPRAFRLHHPFSISRVPPRGIRVHKTLGSRARWTPMNPVWLRGDDSGTTYLCRSTSGFSTGLGEPGVAGVRNGEFPADPRLGAGENRLAL